MGNGQNGERSWSPSTSDSDLSGSTTIADEGHALLDSGSSVRSEEVKAKSKLKSLENDFYFTLDFKQHFANFLLQNDADNTLLARHIICDDKKALQEGFVSHKHNVEAIQVKTLAYTATAPNAYELDDLKNDKSTEWRVLKKRKAAEDALHCLMKAALTCAYQSLNLTDDAAKNKNAKKAQHQAIVYLPRLLTHFIGFVTTCRQKVKEALKAELKTKGLTLPIYQESLQNLTKEKFPEPTELVEHKIKLEHAIKLAEVAGMEAKKNYDAAVCALNNPHKLQDDKAALLASKREKARLRIEQSKQGIAELHRKKEDESSKQAQEHEALLAERVTSLAPLQGELNEAKQLIAGYCATLTEIDEGRLENILSDDGVTLLTTHHLEDQVVKAQENARQLRAKIKKLQSPLDPLQPVCFSVKDKERLAELEKAAEHERGSLAFIRVTDEENAELVKSAHDNEQVTLTGFTHAEVRLATLGERLASVNKVLSASAKNRELLCVSNDLLTYAALSCVVFKDEASALPLPLHKIIQPNAATGVYVSSADQYWYEGAAAGVWLALSLALDGFCEFIHTLNNFLPVTLHHSPDLTMDLFCLALKLVWGMLTAWAITYKAEKSYLQNADKQLSAIPANGEIAQEFESNKFLAAHRFSHMMKYGMYAFQIAVVATQLGFLLFPPAFASALAVSLMCAGISALAAGVCAAITSAYCYRQQVVEDFKLKWTAVNGQYYSGASTDPNGQADKDNSPIHDELHFSRALKVHLNSPAYLIKLAAYMLAGFCTAFAWQCISLIPFGLGSLFKDSVRIFVIPVLAFIVSCFISVVVRALFGYCMQSKDAPTGVVEKLVLTPKGAKSVDKKPSPVALTEDEIHAVAEKALRDYAPTRGLAA